VVEVFVQALTSATFFPDKLKRGLSGDMPATDLADMLARAGVPFRKAHERVARFVTELEQSDRDLIGVGSDELAQRFPELGPHPAPLDFAASVAARTVIGGTAPARVVDQVAQLRAWA